MATDVTIKVNDFELKTSTFLQIVPKPDYDAPQGYIDNGTTKVLHPFVSDYVSCIFDQTLNAWDTGFYEASACYRGKPQAEVKEIVKALQKEIVKPIEAIRGQGVLDPKADNPFWNEFRVDLHDGRLFDTSKVGDLLDVYIALLHNKLAPEDKASLHAYKNASFCIKDKDAVITTKEKRDFEYTEAMSAAFVLFDTDKNKLFLIMENLGIDVHNSMEKKDVITVMNQYFGEKTKGSQYVRMFLDTYKKSNTDQGLLELDSYSKVKKGFANGLVTSANNEYYFNGQELGTSLKDAAYTISHNKGLLAQFREAFNNGV